MINKIVVIVLTSCRTMYRVKFSLANHREDRRIKKLWSFLLCKYQFGLERVIYMSLKKLCKCGASISLIETKCKTCSSKYQSYYDNYKRENKEVYRSNRWKKLTSQCKDKFSGIDIYSLYKYNKLVQGKLSHHIVEVSEDSSKIYDIDNLIFVSDRSHKEIHERYKNNKKETQQELKKYISMWEGEVNKV